MSRKWWTVLITAAVVVGLIVAVKLMPIWATLVAVGSYAFGVFSGYVLKKEKIVEKPVEVIKEVVKRVEVPVEKIVYRDCPAEAESQEDIRKESKPKGKSKNKKVVE